MKLAFVVPWYGKDLAGGAENECRRTAEELSKAGVNVEILTTCSNQFHSNWKNYYVPGTYEVNGVIVRRFKVDARNAEKFDRTNFKLMNGIPVTNEDEKTYLEENINSSPLVKFISDNKRAFDYFIFIPYMFGTTVDGARAAGEKAILIPCLHDEPYARLSIYLPQFERSKAIIFHTDSEKKLAQSLFKLPKKSPVMGEGVDFPVSGNASRFQEKYGAKDFVLYVGRKDEGKGAPMLVDFFGRFAREQHPSAKLVVAGSGTLQIFPQDAPFVMDLGKISEQDKADAYAAASIFCLPSRMESFSLVLMEAWHAGLPTLVNAECDVTREHCEKSNGGLYFSGYEEFKGCLSLLLASRELRQQLGSNGAKYAERFGWKRIVKAYKQFLSSL